MVIASVLAVQSLFSGDGGWRALSCNIINPGFFQAFIASPFIYLPLVRNASDGPQFGLGKLVACVVVLQRVWRDARAGALAGWALIRPRETVQGI